MKNRKDLRSAYLLFGILVLLDVSFLVWYGLNTYMITRPIEIGGTIECNSGKIGIDYESFYNLSRNNFSYYQLVGDHTNIINNNEMVGWTPKIFNIKGIDNLNCKLEFNSKTQVSDLVALVNAYK